MLGKVCMGMLGNIKDLLKIVILHEAGGGRWEGRNVGEYFGMLGNFWEC